MSSINRSFIFCSDPEYPPFSKFCSISLKSHLFYFDTLNWSLRNVENPQEVFLKEKKVKKERLLVKIPLVVILSSHISVA